MLFLNLITMKKLIADSGSTKTDWKLLEDGKITGYFQTKGLNPFFISEENILNTIKEEILPKIKGNMDEIFFYGAGVTDKTKSDKIEKPLSKLFPKAKIEIQSDLLGASRALFGKEAGIVCILGTGSNSCLYDGKEIKKTIPSLGFILGDEGSGNALGKKLLSDYFKEVMPEKLRKLFEEDYKVKLKEILEQVYKESENPARYLASFAPFLSKNIADPYCQQILKKNAIAFFERDILTIPSAREYAIGFVGSVSYYFCDFFIRRACEFGFNSYRIEKKPIDELARFHME